MSDLPDTQRGDRLTSGGRRTDDGRWSTLLVVHEPDGAWTIQLDAPGVILAAEDMVLLVGDPGACPVTDEELCAWVAASRAKQGLPPKVTDPATIQRIVDLIYPPVRAEDPR